MAGVDHHLPAMFEVHSDPRTDDRLHLSDAPLGTGRMADEGTGYEAEVQERTPLFDRRRAKTRAAFEQSVRAQVVTASAILPSGEAKAMIEKGDHGRGNE